MSTADPLLFAWCDGCGHRHKKSEMRYEGTLQFCTTECCSTPPHIIEQIEDDARALLAHLLKNRDKWLDDPNQLIPL